MIDTAPTRFWITSLEKKVLKKHMACCRFRLQNDGMNQDKVKILASLAIICVAALLTGLVLWSWPEPSQPKAFSGAKLLQQPAPATTFAVLDTPEQQQAPEAWRGQPVFVNYFASWCVRCRGEHPLFSELRQAVSTPLIGIAFYDRAADTQKFLVDHGNPYTTVLWDKKGESGRLWGVDAVPHSFVLDAAGTVVWHHRGPINATMLRDQIVPLLQRLATAQQKQPSAQQ